MPKYVKATDVAEMLKNKYGLSLSESVDVVAEMPTADIADVLCKIMNEFCRIIKIPQFPKKSTKYWCVVDDAGRVECCEWMNDIFDKMCLKTGNFFKSEEEAEINKLRMVKMLNDPQPLIKGE